MSRTADPRPTHEKPLARSRDEAHEDRPEPMPERDMTFLLEATRLLAGSLDVEATLASVARLSLPHFGSWCVVDLCEDDVMRRVAIIHPDPAAQVLADKLVMGWPPLRDDPLGVPSVVRTRKSQVVFPVTDEMLVEAARSPENLAILRALEIGSFMSVPLLARDKVLGAITYVSPNHGDSFSERDLVLAEDLAARCAMAIDNSRLLQSAEAAQAQAEEANRVKMRFLSTMSHELRTPLNAIAGYAELLVTGLRGPLPEAALSDLRRIQANQRHLLGLVETVLSYAKLDAGKIQFGMEDVSIADALVDVEGVVAPLAAGKGVACSGCEPAAGGDLTVCADAGQLRQIIVNLVANAIKFCEDGGRVEVTARARGDTVDIQVRDDGPGIAPEHLERIFEPFAQVDSGYTQTHGGTGLGLAISRELARGMGGELSVESEPGHGALFTLTLPRGKGCAPGA
ncbi:MAG TPA: GAF domain-containing sensor histidine kinase [Longimicrobiales bacterium]|nr:GAF domain-containing sensor histidine kinase [Longimicrobiales bacterium]